MNKTTIAGAAALALTLSGLGTAAAQAKAPARSHARHARRASVARDYGSAAPTGDGTGPPNPFDWIEFCPGETALPDLGLVTDVIQGLVGAPLG
jgi:hypothetical protein